MKKTIERKNAKKTVHANKSALKSRNLIPILKYTIALALLVAMLPFTNADDVVVENGKIGVGILSPSERIDASGKVKGTELCIGNDCRTSWPTGSGGLPSGTLGQTLRHDGANWVASSLLNNTGTDNIKIEKNNEIYLNIKNSETGGRQYALVSAGSLGGIGIGKFSIYDKTADASRLTVDSSGNVGIGTTGPGTDVITTTDLSGRVLQLDFGSGVTPTHLVSRGDAPFIHWIDVGGSSNQRWVRSELDANIWAIKQLNDDGTVSRNLIAADMTNGNVGIGTTTPSYKLHIIGDVGWSGTLQTGSVPWARLTSFPSSCPAGQYATAVGGALTCSTPPSGGGVTSISQGGGITLSPNPITATGTISLASQSCPGGQFVTAIGGAITCATPPGGGGVGGSGTTNYIPKWTGGTSLGNSVIYDNGNVGIGTTSPSSESSLNRFLEIESTTANHKVGIILQSGTGSDWEIYSDDNNNDLFMYDGDDIQVRIRNDQSAQNDNGWDTATVDYGEYMRKLNPNEDINPFEIVGIKNGRVTKNTKDAAFYMISSSNAGIRGGNPIDLPRDNNPNWIVVAYTGQVPVLMKGKFEEGDYVLPSGINDGVAIAVSPEKIKPEQYPKVVGRVLNEFVYDFLEESDGGFEVELKKLMARKGNMTIVNVAVGVGSGLIIQNQTLNSRIQSLEDKNVQIKNDIGSLKSRIAILEAKIK